MVMAAIDGIENKIHPGEPLDKNMYHLTEEEYEKIDSAPGSWKKRCWQIGKRSRFPAQGRRLHRGCDSLLDQIQARKRGRRHPASGRIRMSSACILIFDDPHDRSLRFQAKNSLKYPPVRFNDQQRQAIAQGFGHAIIDGSYHIHACCIGHDHAHLVVARHERSIEAISKHLKSKSSMALRSSICHPLAAYAKNNSIPTPWAEGCWSVFISDFEHLSQAVDYVRRHPAKEGLPPQNWDFTIPIPV
jgi:REP element-mobilizing transposase RayT